MKEVMLKNRVIKTPWLRIDEAAAYCGLSRVAFDARAKDSLPHGGDSRTRLYHVKTLDAWLANELDIPFTKQKQLSIPKKRKSRCLGLGSQAVAGIVDSETGKIF